MAYYAVRKGHKPGIYNSWAECEMQVKAYSGAEFKKFKSFKEANNYIKGEKSSLVSRETSNNKFLTEDNLKNDQEAIAYVDGSYDASTRSYGAGVVFLTTKGKETFSARDNEKDLAEMRNVSGELKAAMMAMEYALDQDYKKLYLHYDYQGIESWAKGEWKRNKEGTKSYKSFYDSIKDDLEVVFIKVPAHAGIKYNEEADKLAKDSL